MQPPGGFQLIRLFQRIFRLDHSPLWLKTYRILPISSDRGARARVRACACVCVRVRLIACARVRALQG